LSKRVAARFIKSNTDKITVVIYEEGLDYDDAQEKLGEILDRKEVKSYQSDEGIGSYEYSGSKGYHEDFQENVEADDVSIEFEFLPANELVNLDEVEQLKEEFLNSPISHSDSRGGIKFSWQPVSRNGNVVIYSIKMGR
jgi:hypothetical protein